MDNINPSPRPIRVFAVLGCDKKTGDINLLGTGTTKVECHEGIAALNLTKAFDKVVILPITIPPEVFLNQNEPL